LWLLLFEDHVDELGEGGGVETFCEQGLRGYHEHGLDERQTFSFKRIVYFLVVSDEYFGQERLRDLRVQSVILILKKLLFFGFVVLLDLLGRFFSRRQHVLKECDHLVNDRGALLVSGAGQQGREDVEDAEARHLHHDLV
jgi:hypothetical protein